MSGPLALTVVDGVATVTIDNPPINLFDLGLYIAMAEMAQQLAADPAVRVVVLRSATPGFFIAHFDVTLIQRLPVDAPPATALNDFHVMCEAFRTMPKATIAVIEGRVGGGGSELALSCDMRFAAVGQAVFNQPEVALGILPGGSGTVRLSRLLGRSRAMEVVLGCDDVDAVLAERWGWVNRALPPETKASILRAEKGVVDDLLAEGDAFSSTLGEPRTQALLQSFMDRGGQTVEGESRLGELAGELAGD
jgi:enoyl-CoA hydratase/carnithine racemase